MRLDIMNLCVTVTVALVVLGQAVGDCGDTVDKVHYFDDYELIGKGPHEKDTQYEVELKYAKGIVVPKDPKEILTEDSYGNDDHELYDKSVHLSDKSLHDSEDYDLDLLHHMKQFSREKHDLKSTDEMGEIPEKIAFGNKHEKEEELISKKILMGEDTTDWMIHGDGAQSTKAHHEEMSKPEEIYPILKSEDGVRYALEAPHEMIEEDEMYFGDKAVDAHEKMFIAKNLPKEMKEAGGHVIGDSSVFLKDGLVEKTHLKDGAADKKLEEMFDLLMKDELIFTPEDIQAIKSTLIAKAKEKKLALGPGALLPDGLAHEEKSHFLADPFAKAKEIGKKITSAESFGKKPMEEEGTTAFKRVRDEATKIYEDAKIQEDFKAGINLHIKDSSHDADKFLQGTKDILPGLVGTDKLFEDEEAFKKHIADSALAHEKGKLFEDEKAHKVGGGMKIEELFGSGFADEVKKIFDSEKGHFEIGGIGHDKEFVEGELKKKGAEFIGSGIKHAADKTKMFESEGHLVGTGVPKKIGNEYAGAKQYEETLKAKEAHAFGSSLAHEADVAYKGAKDMGTGLIHKADEAFGAAVHGANTHLFNEAKGAAALEFGSSLAHDYATSVDAAKVHGVNTGVFHDYEKTLEVGKAHGLAHEGSKTFEGGPVIDTKFIHEADKTFKGAQAFDAGKTHGIGESMFRDYNKAYEAAKAHGIGTVHEADKAFAGSKAYGVGTGLMHESEKSFAGGKAHAIGSGLSHEAGKAFEGEKAHAIGTGLIYKTKKDFESKAHAIGSGLAHEAEKKAIDSHLTDEFLKKGKGHFIDEEMAFKGDGKAYEMSYDEARKVFKDTFIKDEEETFQSDGPLKHDPKLHYSKGILLKDKVHGVPFVKEEKTYIETSMHVPEDGKKVVHNSEKAPSMKEKFVKFMKKIFHLKKLHPYLVTMRKRELVEIVNCVSKSKNPMMCEKFIQCEKKMPPQVIIALEKCQKEILPGQIKGCSVYEPLYPTPDVPEKIFDCMLRKTQKLANEEKKMMVDFEKCARKVTVDACSKPKKRLRFFWKPKSL